MFSGFLVRAQQWRDFATAHSRGLRREIFETVCTDLKLCHSAFVRVATILKCQGLMICIFATAHSRGLRLGTLRNRPSATSLPQRIRAGCDLCACVGVVFIDLCHSAFVRVATRPYRYPTFDRASLPQRIRAGCDLMANAKENMRQALCHSAFVRVATAEKQCSALRICCEKVDSFSSVGESGLALTIFPFSFTAKATYVAINDSFGRAIDRFFGANRTGISVSYDFAEHPCL